MTPERSGLLVKQSDPDSPSAVLADEIANHDAMPSPTGPRVKSEDLTARLAAGSRLDDDLRDGAPTMAKSQYAARYTCL